MASKILLALVLTCSLNAAGSIKDRPQRLLLLSFTLQEQPAALTARFGSQPAIAERSGMQQWTFEGAEHDHGRSQATCDGRPEWTANFSLDGQLRSIVHQPEQPLPVAALFPAARSHWVELQPGYGLIVRRLDAKRILIAPAPQGVSQLDQVILIRPDAALALYPVLADLLKK
jgi:hypothetical protein